MVDSGYLLEAEPVEFGSRLDVCNERKRGGRMLFDPDRWKAGVTIY